MKKTVLTIVLFGCLFLAACGGKETSANPTKAPKPTQSALATLAPAATTAPVEEVEQTATETPVPTEAPAPTEIPPESLNPLYQFSFTDPDEKVTFQFPMWYSEYYATGYEDDFMEEAEDIVAPGERMICLYDSLIVYNGTSEPLPAKMCAVVGGFISDYYMEGWYSLPGDVIIGTGTRDEVLAVYGEPTEEQNGILTYELEAGRYVKLTLQDDILVEAEICNIVPMDENKKNFGYALEDLQSFRFKLSDKELQFPLTFSDLEHAGWECQEDASAMLAPEEGGKAAWTKDNYTIFTMVYNITETTIPAKDCAIVSIEVNEVDSIPMFGEYSDELIFPGDIKLMKSTVYDVLVAYGEPTENDSDEELYYEFGEGMNGVYFEADYEEGTITRMQYRYFPWKNSFGSEAR